VGTEAAYITLKQDYPGFQQMRLSQDTRVDQADPVDAARVAIWRLFQEGYVDEDMATAGLLAVDLGTRRAHRNTAESVDPDDLRPLRTTRSACSADPAL
jgi:hypothetical protein